MLRYRMRYCILIALLAVPPLQATPTITITPPTLQPGMEGLQSILNQSISSFSGDLTALVTAMLDKPLLLKASNGAAMQAVLVPACVYDSGYPNISIGSAASFYSPGLSTSFLSELKTIDATTDIAVGACIQPLVFRAAIPADFLVKGLKLGVDAGYMKANAGTYGISACNAGLSALWTPCRPTKGIVSWNGVTLGAGADYAINTITMMISPGSISQVAEIDPDGIGPLVPFTATITVNPDINAGIQSNILAFRIGASTGVTFFDAATLFAGAGVSAGWARSGILIETDEEIVVEGYLGKLIDTNGRITISGTTNEQDQFIIAPYVSAGLSFHVGFFVISIPVVLRPLDSVGTGVFVGVQL